MKPSSETAKHTNLKIKRKLSSKEDTTDIKSRMNKEQKEPNKKKQKLKKAVTISDKKPKSSTGVRKKKSVSVTIPGVSNRRARSAISGDSRYDASREDTDSEEEGTRRKYFLKTAKNDTGTGKDGEVVSETRKQTADISNVSKDASTNTEETASPVTTDPRHQEQQSKDKDEVIEVKKRQYAKEADREGQMKEEDSEKDTKMQPEETKENQSNGRSDLENVDSNGIVDKQRENEHPEEGPQSDAVHPDERKGGEERNVNEGNPTRNKNGEEGSKGSSKEVNQQKKDEKDQPQTSRRSRSKDAAPFKETNHQKEGIKGDKNAHGLKEKKGDKKEMKKKHSAVSKSAVTESKGPKQKKQSNKTDRNTTSQTVLILDKDKNPFRTRSPAKDEEPKPFFKENPFDDTDDADCIVLRQALFAKKVDKTTVNLLLSTRTHSQRQKIREAYRRRYDQDPVEDVRNNIRGDYQDLVVALLQDQCTQDATLMNFAFSGVGTNESVLIHLLASRSPEDLIEIKRRYVEMYDHDADEDIKGDTSGSFQILCLVQLNKVEEDGSQTNDFVAEQDARRIWRPSERSTQEHDDVMIEILTSFNPDQYALVSNFYKKISGIEMKEAIRRSTRGDFQDALLALASYLEDSIGYHAETLQKALKGFRRDDRILINIIVSRLEIDLDKIKTRFFDRYNKTLEQAIKNSCGGDYCKLLLALITNV